MIRAVILFPILGLGLYGLGEWCRLKLLGEEEFSIGRIGRALGFGILIHGLLMTLLGFTGLLQPSIAAILTALPALVFWKIWYRDLRLIFRKSTWRPSTTLNVVEIVFLILIIALALVRLFTALAPNISWDATSHHYLVPAEWLKTGGFHDIPSIVFSYYPALTEAGIAGTMALGSDFLSNLYGWLFGALSILLLIGIGTRHFNGSAVELPLGNGKTFKVDRGRFVGITAAFIFTLLPGVGVQTSGGYVDLPLACWTLLSIDMIFELARRPAWPVLVSAGLATGAVLATKHTGLLLGVGLTVLLFWVLFAELDSGKPGAKNRWKYILVFLGLAILIPMPWYLRSVVLTGNPLYPFGFFGLPTPPHPPFTPSSWLRPDYDRSIPGLLSYWLYLVFEPKVAHDLGRNYSIAFPLLFPLVLLFPRIKPRARLITILSGFCVLFIYYLFPMETRYHIPFLPPVALALAILIASWVTGVNRSTGAWLLLIGEIIALCYLLFGTGISQLTDLSYEIKLQAIIVLVIVTLATIPLLIPKIIKHGLSPILIFLVVFGLCSFAFDFRVDGEQLIKRTKVVLNLEAEDAYMLRESPFNYGTIHHINHNMDPENMRILCLEPRLYRLEADWVTWYGLDEPVVPTTPAENVAIWYRGGFTHIMLGDDIALKALMYFNIVHQKNWDVPGLTPDGLVEYLREHPEEDKVRFRLEDLWTNFAGDPFTDRSRHFTHFWLPRELEIAMFETEERVGETWYAASRFEILTDPISLNQYAFVRDFREMVDTGGIKVVYTDELTYLFECDYEAYSRSHPDVDLETLGLLDED